MPVGGHIACFTHSSRRVWMSGHESCSWGSEYIRNKILRLQARLLVSCFNKLGLDFPLNPEGKREKQPLLRNDNRGLCVLNNKSFSYSPALQSAVLCSLLELKSLAKVCDSSRQSSSLKRCADVIRLYIPWSAAESPPSISDSSRASR